MDAIDAPHAALYGALIGSLGGVVAQLIAQGLTAWREGIQRARIEEGTVHAFRGILQAVEISVRSLPPMVAHVPFEEFARFIVPLRGALERPEFYLNLKPGQITAMFAVLDATEGVCGALESYHRDPALYSVTRPVETALRCCEAAAKELGMRPFERAT